MEEPKFPRSERQSLPINIKSISLNASRGDLWTQIPIDKAFKSNLQRILPIINLSSNFKQNISRLIKDPNFELDIDRYITGTISYNNNTEISLLDIHSISKINKNEQLIKLIQTPEISRNLFEVMLKNTIKKIDSFDKYENLNVMDLCIPIVQCFKNNSSFSLRFSLFLPMACFIFQQIAPLKILSTPLSISLTRRETFSYKYQSGFLTMDRKRRILPLKANDAQVLKYPLIGIWATGVDTELN